ncbi:hypothetical protein G3I44_09170 [Halogeometricum borinquense]|uniref:Uncharacterized protein n=1 Tax=Halogeometricum borinquense TaxID=60847 RepID=A0A6C0UKR4_9EURY|nr:hypothetical protein [Halogeometricum borinquense]QIB74439.1 hypothetical protein G3I44_09170 [Halogeometricum borinquense]
MTDDECEDIETEETEEQSSLVDRIKPGQDVTNVYQRKYDSKPERNHLNRMEEKESRSLAGLNLVK